MTKSLVLILFLSFFLTTNQAIGRGDHDWAPKVRPFHGESFIQPMVQAGDETDPKDFPETVRVTRLDGSSGCSATVVSPKVILFAGHCDFENVKFKIGEEEYTAKTTLSPDYVEENCQDDLRLAVVDRVIKGVVPAKVMGPQPNGKMDLIGEHVTLAGWGCKTRLGEYDERGFGVFRTGEAKVKGIDGTDIVIRNGSSSCGGDSGGSIFKGRRDAIKRKNGKNRLLMAVISKGSADANMAAEKRGTWSARLDTKKSQAFLKKFAADNKVEICGVTSGGCGQSLLEGKDIVEKPALKPLPILPTPPIVEKPAPKPPVVKIPGPKLPIVEKPAPKLPIVIKPPLKPLPIVKKPVPKLPKLPEPKPILIVKNPTPKKFLLPITTIPEPFPYVEWPIHFPIIDDDFYPSRSRTRAIKKRLRRLKKRKRKIMRVINKRGRAKRRRLMVELMDIQDEIKMLKRHKANRWVEPFPFEIYDPYRFYWGDSPFYVRYPTPYHYPEDYYNPFGRDFLDFLSPVAVPAQSLINTGKAVVWDMFRL